MPELAGGRLQAERARMIAYRMAVTDALTQRPVSDSPTMVALYPGAANLYAAVREYRDTLPHDHPLARALEHITIYVRTHADLIGIQTFLGVTDEWVDDLFRDAMAIDAATQP